MKKFLIYYNFTIVSLVVTVGFLSARTLGQLITAILFFPMFVFFLLRILPRRNRAIHLPKKHKAKSKIDSSNVILAEDGEKVTELKKEGVDIDRRAFLKLIGTAGLSLFLFSMFTKRAEAAFFGSVPGPGTVAIKDTLGNKIDPAVKQPTDGYKIAELDDSSPAYYGFTDKDGAWFIMKEDATTGAYRYAKGASSFSTNWTNRAALSYDYFENVF